MSIWAAILLGFLALLVIWNLLETRRHRQALKKTEEQDQSALLMKQEISGLRNELRTNLDGNTQLINQQLGQVMTQVFGQLSEMGKHMTQQLEAGATLMQQVNRNIGERLDTASQMVGQVQRGLGKLEEANKRVYEVGKDIAGLQELLRAPKLRGSIGEFLLGDLLGQILPPGHYTLQHTFKSGERVDAVIRLGDRLVPVDAKFPLENFRRIAAATDDAERAASRKRFAGDVKKHAEAIAQKYILPDEGTFDFALMYIPAENVYYETIIKDDQFGEEKSINAHALSRRVIPVSPSSFYAYLQAILLGLKGLRIEERTQEIIATIARLGEDFRRFETDFRKLGTHLSHAKSSYESSDKRLERFVGRLGQIESLEEEPSARALTERASEEREKSSP
jgi:DNA recombination protein RmuC